MNTSYVLKKLYKRNEHIIFIRPHVNLNFISNNTSRTVLSFNSQRVNEVYDTVEVSSRRFGILFDPLSGHLTSTNKSILLPTTSQNEINNSLLFTTSSYSWYCTCRRRSDNNRCLGACTLYGRGSISIVT